MHYSIAAGGNESQGCFSSQGPRVVLEPALLGKPLHRGFHPLIGIVPRNSHLQMGIHSLPLLHEWILVSVGNG